MHAGVLTMRVFYFEKKEEGAFLPPDAYPQEAMLAVGTHDLPTLAAYWSSADLALRKSSKTSSAIHGPGMGTAHVDHQKDVIGLVFSQRCQAT